MYNSFHPHLRSQRQGEASQGTRLCYSLRSLQRGRLSLVPIMRMELKQPDFFFSLGRTREILMGKLALGERVLEPILHVTTHCLGRSDANQTEESLGQYLLVILFALFSVFVH